MLAEAGLGHKPTWQESNPPTLASATQLQACVSHITLFAPESYGNLGCVGFRRSNAAEIYS
jgi:hypothetical protein